MTLNTQIDSPYEQAMGYTDPVAWRDLTVAPVLRTATGMEISLAPVSVPSEHVASVDVRQALLEAAPHLI